MKVLNFKTYKIKLYFQLNNISILVHTNPRKPGVKVGLVFIFPGKVFLYVSIFKSLNLFRNAK